MGDTETRVRPFSCGSQFADWESLNCDRCVIGYDNENGAFRCDLQEAIGLAHIGDGTISATEAKSIGHAEAHKDEGYPYGWPCTVFKPRSGYCPHHRKLDTEKCPHGCN